MFLHLCHRIWDGFLKKQSRLPQTDRIDLLQGGTIEKDIQTVGILFASNEWFRKLPEEPGGDARQRFIDELGRRLNDGLLKDLPMRYPGGNGISVPEVAFESRHDDVADLRRFVREAVDYGGLWETHHSSKSKIGGRRIKFYLNPILCPRFQLPAAKTKEPCYWNVTELLDLARRAQVTISRARVRKPQEVDKTQFLPGFRNTTS